MSEELQEHFKDFEERRKKSIKENEEVIKIGKDALEKYRNRFGDNSK